MRRRRRGIDIDRAGVDARPASTEPAVDRGRLRREAPSTEAPSTEAAVDRGSRAALDLDTNGDGTVVFGIAAAGPRDDGGYYQALVDEAIAVSEENGYGDPIVVDNITTEDAATELANLAEQGVDTIFVGASEIADPLTDLIARVPGHLLVLQLRCRLSGEPRLGPEPGRLVRDQLHGRLRDRSAAAGIGWRQRRVHRMLRPELREGGLPGLRARSEGGRRQLHDDVHPDRWRSRSTSTTPPARRKH